MKNSLTKTLLCGVMATTFFLINCQKAPSRGVKAKTAGTADVAADKLAGKIIVDCTPDFTKAMDAARISKDKIMNNVKTAITDKKLLSEAEKAEMAKGRLEVIEKNDVVKAEMSKMTKDGKAADACKDAKNTSIFEDIKAQMDKLVSDAGTLVGATDEAQTNALKARTDREKAVQADVQLIDGLELVVSSDLAPLMVSLNKDGVVYFKTGSIVKESSSYEADKADKAKTICLLADVSSEDQKLEGLDKVKVLGLSGVVKKSNGSNLVDNRSIVTFKLGKGDLFESIKCLIAESKVATYKKEIRDAFGRHLLTQAQLDASTSKAKVAATKAGEARKAKEDALKAATDKVTAAQEALDSKNAEVAAASGDNTKAKALSERSIELKNALDKAKEDQAKAQSELEDAIKSEGNAAQRS